MIRLICATRAWNEPLFSSMDTNTIDSLVGGNRECATTMQILAAVTLGNVLDVCVVVGGKPKVAFL